MNFENNVIYHIYNQGNNRQKIFHHHDNYLYFLKKMRSLISPHVEFLAYCLMPNHFHWLVYVKEVTIEVNPNGLMQSEGMAHSHALAKLQPFHSNQERTFVQSEGMAQSHALAKLQPLLSNQDRTFVQSEGMAQSHTLANPNHLVQSEGMAHSHALTGSKKFRTLNESIGILLRSYSSAINKQEKRSGSLFRKHTKAKCGWIDELITLEKFRNRIFLPHDWSSDYGWNCFHYIHQNPVEAGLVGKQYEWEYSSAPDYAHHRNGTLCNQALARELLILPDGYLPK